jgi:hypothetical protein
MIFEHHRSLLRFASRSSTGGKRLLLPLVAIGIVTRATLACLARARPADVGEVAGAMGEQAAAGGADRTL